MSDERLEQLFGSLNEDLPAHEFKERVFRRIERADRIRYLVLTVAGAVGLAIAARPLLDLLRVSEGALEILIMTWRDIDWTADPTAVAIALLLVILPGIVRWLEG
jgi:hypothetical protein